MYLPREWGVELKEAVKKKKGADSVKVPGQRPRAVFQKKMPFFRFQASGKDNSIM